MRITNSLRLAALCVLAGSFQASCSTAEAQLVQHGPKKLIVNKEFKGYGLTPKDAEQDALKSACEELSKPSNLGWAPEPEFLREKGMVRFGQPTEENFEKSGPMQVVTMHLEVTAEQARAIQKQAREERMKSRQWVSLLGLGGMVCLLAVAGAYLRLEEATKGYYTRLLRLAAVGIVLIVIVGLCVAA
jgi:hypothetical protein